LTQINPRSFGESCPDEWKQEVKQVLQITQETFETKYVGLPIPEGRINKGKFQSLQAKMLGLIG
jgi:hypothetical protein